jgi:phosphoribosylamine--glycine ligase / phosphoribosylformylglycinamidine cyclo-ligase
VCLDVIVFHAGTISNGNVVSTAGGRVIAVSSYGATLPDALEKAYQAVDAVSFEGKTYRRDIAYR